MKRFINFRKIIESLFLLGFVIVLVSFVCLGVQSFSADAKMVTLFIFYGLLGLALAVFLIKNKQLTKPVICSILGAYSLLIILILAFSTRLAYETDLRFLFGTAKNLTQYKTLWWNENSYLYYGTFPHTITYPLFISLFMKVFGTQEFVHIGINTLTEIGIVIFTFLYVDLVLSRKWAVVAGICVGLHPFMWIYANTPNAELLFGFCALSAIYFYTYWCKTVEKETTNKKVFSKASLSLLAFAFLSAAANYFRPFAIVLIVAISIHLVIYMKKQWIRKITAIGLMLIMFFVVSVGIQIITKALTGHDYPKQSYGWNLYVGASETGMWNGEDGDEIGRLFEEVQTPTDVQTYFAQKGWERYAKMGINVIPHSLSKLKVWLFSDYMVNVITQQEKPSSVFLPKAMFGYQLIVYLYDWFFLLFGFTACVLMLLRSFRKKSTVDVSAFFLAGSVLLLMIVEAATRYTVSYRIFFVILSIQLFSVLKCHIHFPTKSFRIHLP